MSTAVIDDKHQRLEHRTLGNAASDWKRAEFKSFPPNKLKSFFSSKSSKCSKTENGRYFFLCSPLLNVDQHEARKKKSLRPPRTHTPNQVGPTSASERREFFGGSASEWEGQDDQLVSPQGTWCRRVSEEATKR